MPVSFEFLRGALGVIGVACAFMTGRAAAAIRKGWMKPSRLSAWVLRVLVCLGALVIRHPVDTVAVMVWTLAVLAFACGWIATARQKPPEDLTHQIFPE
jgi:peptidoglycan/LPS O-acetylase OafA/YrhL